MLTTIFTENGFSIFVKRLRPRRFELKLLMIAKKLHLGLYLFDSCQNIREIWLIFSVMIDFADLVSKLEYVFVDGLDFGLDLDFDVVKYQKYLILDYLTNELLLLKNARRTEIRTCATKFARHLCQFFKYYTAA